MTTVLISIQSGTVTLTLNRPERANSFNFEMVNELRNALADAEQDAQVRCVVITGGGKVFSAGQDISEMKQGEKISYREHLERTYNPLILQIRKMGKPVVAAVNGPCAGAALAWRSLVTCGSPNPLRISWWALAGLRLRLIRESPCCYRLI